VSQSQNKTTSLLARRGMVVVVVVIFYVVHFTFDLVVCFNLCIYYVFIIYMRLLPSFACGGAIIFILVAASSSLLLSLLLPINKLVIPNIFHQPTDHPFN
jgi:uncharacterized membrane protein YagU involved in acid resistance